MRSTYRVLAYLVAAGVALQASSIALGFFSIIREVDDGGVISAAYDYESNVGLMMHRYVGSMLIPLCVIALLVVSFFTRAPGAVRWAATLFGLVLLQVVLVFLAFDVAVVAAALHGLNALVLLFSAIWAGWRVTRVGDRAEKELDAALA
jgi:hypothetical protein